MTRVIVTRTLVVCLAAACLRAQEPEPLPRFDVASVKQDTSSEPSNNWQRSPGRLDYQNSQMLQLIRVAYGEYALRANEIEGAPGWLTSERYDIDVRFPVGTPQSTLNMMLRQLLTDRFKFSARLETRAAPIYSLVLARSDGRLGAKLESPVAACAPTAFNPLPECARTRAGIIQRGHSEIAELARLLSMTPAVGRPVVDNTGLTGAFKVDLRYASVTDAPDPDAPSIFTALQEQLGLKLESATGPVTVLVIDRIERPMPD